MTEKRQSITVVCVSFIALICFVLASCSDLYDQYEGSLDAENRILVSALSLDKTSLDLKVPDTCQLTVSISPYNATDKKVAWSSKDSSVATVSSSGLVTAVKSGSTKITITSNDGNSHADCTVTVTQIPVANPTMISVPGGTTTINGVTVSITSFSMSSTEITQAQYAYAMNTLSNSCLSNYGLGDDYPIYNVSWYDAIVFCNRLSLKNGKTPVFSINGSTNPETWGSVPIVSSSIWDSVIMNIAANGYRLPTEAEWEYAAKGGQKTNYYTYSGSNYIDSVAWYKTNGNSSTHPSGSKLANELGLYDMTGNVWEWCWDWYNSSAYPSISVDPTGPASGTERSTRGGSILNDVDGCEVSYRNSQSSYLADFPTYSYLIGIRVVCR